MEEAEYKKSFTQYFQAINTLSETLWCLEIVERMCNIWILFLLCLCVLQAEDQPWSAFRGDR